MFRVITDDTSEVTLSDGNDTAYIQGNNSTVIGALGDDRLAALLDHLSPEPVATSLWGGEGDDTLHAALSTTAELEGRARAVTAELYGGDGDDEIEILASSLGGRQLLTAVGGAGTDTITIDSNYGDDEGFSHTVDVIVDGGNDADVIKVTVFAASNGSTIINGGSGDDSIEADGLANQVRGGDGDDTIVAIASETAEWSNSTFNYVEGGDGHDVIRMDDRGSGATNTGHGGDGNDRLTLDAVGYAASNFAFGDEGDDVLNLHADGSYWAESAIASNQGHGGDGDDSITASVDLKTLIGDDFTLLPFSGRNLLHGNGGDDTLTGTISVDDPSGLEYAYSELSGGAGNDSIKASGGFDNILRGNQGDDTLLGSGNADRLIGGAGADQLRGNGGADTFEFRGARGLSAGERDRIVDFGIGSDLIDVSRIDANAFRSGNQAFRFSGEGEWQGTGRIWVEDNPDNDGSIVYASTGRKMFAINLLDGASVDASDYGASDFIL